MSTHVANLKSQLRSLATDMRAALDKNDMPRWKEMNAKAEQLQSEITTVERRLSANLPGIHTEFERSQNPLEEHRASREYERAFNKAFLSRDQDMSELRALGETISTGGQALVPIGLQKEIAIQSKAWGNWYYDLARTLPTASGEPLVWPIETDANAEGPEGQQAASFYAENAGPTTETDPVFNSVTFNAYLYDSGIVKVPVSLFGDAAFSIEALVSSTFGRRLGRKKESALMVGDNSITGLIPSLTASGSGATMVEAVGAADNTGGSQTAQNSFGTDDLGALIAGVDPFYRNSPGCGFVANQASWDYLRTLKDRYGRLLWSAGLTDSAPNSILGYPIRFSQSMDNIGAGNISVVFGDLKQVIVREVLGMTLVRFNELFMQYHQIGYESYQRYDSKVLITDGAFSYLYHPLS